MKSQPRRRSHGAGPKSHEREPDFKAKFAPPPAVKAPAPAPKLADVSRHDLYCSALYQGRCDCT